MMEEDKFKDLLEDEELTALRLAALATKKKNDERLNKSEAATAKSIDSIVNKSSPVSELESNQIPFVQSHRSAHNSYSWMKQNPSQRRFPEKTHCVKRRGVIKIPLNSVKSSRYKKSSHLNGIQDCQKNQRSNLIVISPVTLNDAKDSVEKAPPLILPQHKWCNSGNEDSMSPKTLRKTGPTRFNRHGSDSESSEDESDYEPSDNDSGSNETILQDEPSEHFSRLSTGCDNLSDNVEKKRRLSFQSLDSDVKSDTYERNEATSVYKSLKSSLYSDTKQDKYNIQQHLDDREQTFSNSDSNRYSNCNSGHTYTSDLSEDLSFKQSNSCVVADIDNSSVCYSKEQQNSQNFRLNEENHSNYLDKRQSLQAGDTHGSRNSVWQHSDGFRTDNSLYPIENQCISSNSKRYIDDNDKTQYLSESDLRLELKKRMQDMQSKSTCIETNEMSENQRYPQYNSWDRSRERYSHKGNEGDLPLNSFDETQISSLHQVNNTNQSFCRENDTVDHSASRRRSCRSLSKERSSGEKFSGRDKRKSEHNFSRRRHDRSSSEDRNKNAHSSSRDGRRRERSSSHEEKRHERSSSQSRIKYKSNEDKSERSLSPRKNKFEHSYRYNKSNEDRCVTEEVRDKYKSSLKTKSEWYSSQELNRDGHSSSIENKHGRSASLDRNKNSVSNSRHKECNASDKDRHYTLSHDEKHLSRGRHRHMSNSSHDRNRHDHSFNHDRSRHGSSPSPDSRSEHSSSERKKRYSSSLERSKSEHSSSESESRYKCNSKGAYSVPELLSDQSKNIYTNFMHQKTNMKEIESVCDVNSVKIKNIESPKVSTKDQSKFIDQDNFEKNRKKEKILTNKKPQQEYSSVRTSYKKRYSRSRSSSSESCSSSYSSSSSHSTRPKIRSVPSVIKPVSVKNDADNRINSRENKPVGKNLSSIIPQSSVHFICTKKNLDNVEINKSSNVKCGRIDGDPKAPEGKRVPVHMRLGAFPRKRVIQMPKDVEAAFVNSSSSSDDETINAKCKRQNIRIVTDMFDAGKNRIDLIQQKYSSDDKPPKRPSPDIHKEKSKRMKAHR